MSWASSGSNPPKPPSPPPSSATERALNFGVFFLVDHWLWRCWKCCWRDSGRRNERDARIPLLAFSPTASDGADDRRRRGRCNAVALSSTTAPAGAKLAVGDLGISSD